jgi:hypothetical protein
MTKWQELYTRFRKISEITGRDKSSSFVMNVIFTPDNGVGIELGTYDIGGWPRHLFLGPFDTEEEAFIATEQKIKEADGRRRCGADWMVEPINSSGATRTT